MELTEECGCGAVKGELSYGQLYSHLSARDTVWIQLTSDNPGLLGQYRRKEPPGAMHFATPLSIKKKETSFCV